MASAILDNSVRHMKRVSTEILYHHHPMHAYMSICHSPFLHICRKLVLAGLG